MFGKKHLAKDGTQGQGVVMAADRHGGIAGSGGTSTVTYDLTVRVHFDDGTSTEFSEHIGNMFKGAGAGFAVGDIVPVRYDASDHSKIEVDRDAIKAKQDADQDYSKQLAQQKADKIDARLAAGELPPMSASESMRWLIDMEGKLAAGTISQEEFDTQKAAMRDRNSL